MRKSPANLTLLFTIPFSLSAQTTFPGTNSISTIPTAVPFLLITPDAPSGGMGDCGAATAVDANSIHWNCAKLAFAPHNYALSLSYTPWLRALVPDINLIYVSSYARLKHSGTIGASLSYFSMGNITYSPGVNPVGQFRPNEMAIDACYSKKLNTKISAGIAVRYINSNLTQGIAMSGMGMFPAHSFAFDASAYYSSSVISLFERPSYLKAGISVSNLGPKMEYSRSSAKDFLPGNLRMGAGDRWYLDQYNSIELDVDLNKLLVPSPPQYEIDTSTGSPAVNPNTGQYVIRAGKDPDRPWVKGVLGSFSDAPDGFAEELHEITLSAGAAYWYRNMFAVRTGYFFEHPTKGNRQYFTLGAGARYNVFELDFAYLIPSNGERSPLQNTLRFSLMFDFDKPESKPLNGGNVDPFPG